MPVGSNSGIHTSSYLLEADLHLHADVHVVGLAPDDVRGEVDRRVVGEGDVGDDVGRVELRQPLLMVDREPDHRARPLIGAGRVPVAATRGQTGAGGCTRASHSSQPWIRRVPSAPDVQNHPFHGSSLGSGRVGTISSGR